MTISVCKTVYSSCASGCQKVRTDNTVRAQGMRTFDPRLNSVSEIRRDANSTFGRMSSHNAMNGSSGTMDGFAGLNPSSYIGLTTDQRQVAYQINSNCSHFQDTIAGANRSYAPSNPTSSGATLGVPGGPLSYTLTSRQN